MRHLLITGFGYTVFVVGAVCLLLEYFDCLTYTH